MALIELTLEQPALKRTAADEGDGSSSRSRLTYLALGVLVIAGLALAVRTVRG